MFQFIYWLKALAVILITNSHYADIWPVSAMAAGGHWGNCLFFLVSGFCLCHMKDSFPKWYTKRIVRIYPVLWIAVIINLLVGFFSIRSVSVFIQCFLYPTSYHFIASIMLLYILFYLVRKIQGRTGLKTKSVLLITIAVFAIVYLFWFDKSYYHIDRVEENWVRFQFWFSMMLGVWLRERYDAIEPQIPSAEWIVFGVLFVGYFAGKVLVSRYQSLSMVQFLSPALLVMLVYHTALIFIKLEKRGVFASTPKANQIAQFLASITLEVYLVQNVIVQRLSYLVFPLNLMVVTVLIVVHAWVVHLCAVWLQKRLGKLLKI